MDKTMKPIHITIIVIFLLIFNISVNMAWLLKTDNVIEQQVEPITTYEPDNDILYPVRKPSTDCNYTNSEIRQAICYIARYGDNPSALSHDHYDAFYMWKDYERRVVNASYLYWVVSYAFNI